MFRQATRLVGQTLTVVGQIALLDGLIPRTKDQEGTHRGNDRGQSEKSRGGQHQDPIPLRPLAQVFHHGGATCQDRTLLEESAQIVGQILGRGIATIRIGRHRGQNDRLQVPGHGGIDGRGGAGSLSTIWRRIAGRSSASNGGCRVSSS